MSKRFIDTNMFDDSWFMDLTSEGKVGYLYFITKCDHAGILKLNKKLFEFQTGIKWATVKEQLGNRLVTVKEDVYFMPKYIEFQYPNWPNSKVKQQESAIKILTELGLFKEGYLRVSKQLNNSYDNDNDNESDTVYELTSENLNTILSSESLNVAIKSLRLARPEIGRYLFSVIFWNEQRAAAKTYATMNDCISHFINWYKKTRPELTDEDKRRIQKAYPQKYEELER